MPFLAICVVGSGTRFLSGISVIEEQADKTIANRIGTYLYDRDGKAILTVRGVPARLQTGSDGKPLEPARLAAGTGIGQVSPDKCAAQMRIAWRTMLEPAMIRSFAAIHELHRALRLA